MSLDLTKQLWVPALFLIGSVSMHGSDGPLTQVTSSAITPSYDIAHYECYFSNDTWTASATVLPNAMGLFHAGHGDLSRVEHRLFGRTAGNRFGRLVNGLGIRVGLSAAHLLTRQHGLPSAGRFLRQPVRRVRGGALIANRLITNDGHFTSPDLESVCHHDRLPEDKLRGPASNAAQRGLEVELGIVRWLVRLLHTMKCRYNPTGLERGGFRRRGSGGWCRLSYYGGGTVPTLNGVKFVLE